MGQCQSEDGSSVSTRRLWEKGSWLCLIRGKLNRKKHVKFTNIPLPDFISYFCCGIHGHPLNSSQVTVTSRIMKPSLKCQCGIKKAGQALRHNRNHAGRLHASALYESWTIIKWTHWSSVRRRVSSQWKSLAELAAPDTLFRRIYGLIIRH